MLRAALYIASGFLLGLAINFVAPPAASNFAAGVRAASSHATSRQVVDRIHKTDRLPLAAKFIQPVPPARLMPAPQKEPVVADCDRHFLYWQLASQGRLTCVA